MFKKEGAEIKVVLTKNALEFVGVKTLETLSQNPVYCEEFEKTFSTEHISLADWADVFLVAPISANTISKFALGVCDNLLTSVFCAYLGSKKPVVVAPSMNDGMCGKPFCRRKFNKA
jgi:phosphopantothenoylcysteine decarboxylase/phosphopantothenate--cysteine ligase